ncbi:glycosyltransferase [Priestia megaterium]|jgi:glycosyltransferase involved in cell wall biosynthesis|uniref:glycosyltransferase family 2 protein n=1 Tax=Priestia megaterium TaxID=1404 RepID=UPI000BF2C4D3|nr:glycosyltransferase [Priestia megaterium]MCM3155473.1 glycosyltransferase [Priestia megaterium]PEU71805.1 glycosyl transferase family 2 [Priestia megaterium]PFQ79851.1 glycosyl transferase family 2 [Priestia megaterium]PFW46998.1 glycosyl transferase family 2 [Priestia megaterium]TJZ31363.1 glycosyltransferase [Priestia megaterium]
MEKVSVVVPFYNCPYIDQALESLVNQTYKNIEIIVVDDGSTLHLGKVTPYLNNISYIKKENGGTATALNTGINHATGTYFCWLSSDDIYDRKRIEAQLKFMKIKKASFCYSNYCSINEKSRIISPPLGINPLGQRELLKTMIKGNIINGCSVMIKMNVFQEVGLFDETLLYTHDYELWLRIIQNFEAHYLNNVLLRYRVHDNMGTKKHYSEIEKEVTYVRAQHEANIKKLLSF